jgi:hypothetical protein
MNPDEARELLLRRISRSHQDIEYYKEQVDLAKQVLRSSKDRFEAAENQIALHETLSNLNAEEKALRYFNNKLETGDFSLEQSSIAGTKRKA